MWRWSNKWDYQSQHLLKKIDCFQSINFICLKTNNYLYIGFDNGEIILKDIISEKVLTIYRGHKKGISALKKYPPRMIIT